MTSTASRTLSALAARFGRDDRGVSAVEFAMIAPILLVFYFGCVEVSQLMTVDRKITSVASAVGDLVAQDDMVDGDEVDDIFDAARAIMTPFDDAQLQMRVTSLQMDADGDIAVLWSRARGMAPHGCEEVVAVPEGVLAANQSVIRAEVSLSYTSPMGQFLTQTYDLEDVFFLRPRRSPAVEFDPATC